VAYILPDLLQIGPDLLFILVHVWWQWSQVITHLQLLLAYILAVGQVSAYLSSRTWTAHTRAERQVLFKVVDWKAGDLFRLLGAEFE